MKRLIETLEQDIVKYRKEIESLKKENERLKFIIEFANVIEVVRCKDCKYVLKEDEHEYWCNGFCSPARLVTPTTFCSHGMRRKSNE